MRILHLLSQTELTGSEVYAQTLAHAQAEAGHHIFVISDHLHRPFPGTTLEMSISTGSFWRRMQNIRELLHFLEREKIDVIHCHSRAACRHAFWATRFSRTPMVTTLHGYQHTSFSKRLFDIYGDTVIAVCEKIRDQLCHDFKADPARVKVIRNPIESVASPNAPTTEPSLRHTIALIGRASGPKGRRLTEVFREQARSWLEHDTALEIELVLPGLTELQKSELMRSFPLPLQKRVHVEIHHKPLADVFARSKVVIASGRIAIEAFFAGCEVVGLGEARLEGHLNDDSLSTQLATNFGDVGNEAILDVQAVNHEVRKALRDPLSIRQREKIGTIFKREFGLAQIVAEIEEIYRGARLWKKSPGLPILMYHKVPDAEIQTKHRIFVTRENFEKHIWFFQSQGFTTLTFQDLSDFWFERRPLTEFPAKPLFLTFDDGYLDNFTNALPLLEKYKMKATIFLLADPSLTVNSWDEDEGFGQAPLMTLEQKKTLPTSVYEIGSHGLQHLELPQLSDAEVLTQMTESKTQLEADLGRKIVAFASPFGRIDSRISDLCQKAGYDFAVNTDRGALRWVDDRHSMFRVNIFPEESWLSLWKKTSLGYRKRYFKKRGQ